MRDTAHVASTGIVTRYRLLPAGVGEHGELLRAVAHHQQVFRHPPDLVAGDRGFHLPPVQAVALRAAGAKQVAVPWQGPSSAERRALEHSRAWRRRYRWRAGIEGRIHSLRRDYGLKRCRDHGEVGMERCVGWGILASNLWHIGQACAKRASKAARSGQEEAPQQSVDVYAWAIATTLDAACSGSFRSAS